MKLAQKLKAKNVVPYKEFIKIIPHPVVIQSLTDRFPVVVQDVDGIAERREALGKLVPRLQHIRMEEYGYHKGLLKNKDLLHTHVNPIIDQIPAVTQQDFERYPETYREHKWPELEGYRELISGTFDIVRANALILAKHIDAYMTQTVLPQVALNSSHGYKSLYEMTRDSQCATARSFYYRERQASDDQTKPSFNFHYDRMNISATLKDLYYLNGKSCENPEGAGLYFNVKEGELYNLEANDEDISYHIGMTGHILTAGVIPASCHAVYLPSTPGLARVSSAFFFSPKPKTDIIPPYPYDVTKGIPQDRSVLPSEIGLQNYQHGMKYDEFNEKIVEGFKKVFFNKDKN